MADAAGGGYGLYGNVVILGKDVSDVPERFVERSATKNTQTLDQARRQTQGQRHKI
jgi:hypothetical protein